MTISNGQTELVAVGRHTSVPFDKVFQCFGLKSCSAFLDNLLLNIEYFYLFNLTQRSHWWSPRVDDFLLQDNKTSNTFRLLKQQSSGPTWMETASRTCNALKHRKVALHSLRVIPRIHHYFPLTLRKSIYTELKAKKKQDYWQPEINKKFKTASSV